MKLEDNVLRAIEAFDRGNRDEALMHASISIDGTARNCFSKARPNKKDYKSCLRRYCWIIERFIGEGLNLVETKFTHLKLDNGYGKCISNPDIADIVYHIFRCSNAHAEEIPINFQLLPSEDGHYIWRIDRLNNSVQMPETIIWALLGVSIFCKDNADIQTQGEHFLTWGNKNIGLKKFIVKDSWGKEDELKEFFSNKSTIRLKLEGL
jgi:hypothetical protein